MYILRWNHPKEKGSEGFVKEMCMRTIRGDAYQRVKDGQLRRRLIYVLNAENSPENTA